MMMKAEINRYQQAFQIKAVNRDPKLREELILEYAPFVKYIAERMAIRLPPHILKEELVSAGIIGLFDAMDKFDAEVGIKFRTYAEHRIKGAILDELREMDWVPRTVRRDLHRIETAMRDLKIKIGREPEDSEVAQELGVDMASYDKMLSKAQGVALLSLDEIASDGISLKLAEKTSNVPSPLENLQVKELKKVIAQALKGLDKKEQLVMSLYYYEEMTLKEIAEILELTESRISQIHSKAVIKLRAKLRDYHKG